MALNEERIQSIAKEILTFRKGHKWTNIKDILMNKMMESESFRINALRFTDVAPTLRTDKEFTEHLNAYFGDIDLLGKIISGKLISKATTSLVKSNIESMAETFILGENIKDALPKLKKLHNQNIAISVDLLGEAVITQKEAKHFTESYINTIKTLSQETAKWSIPKYPETDRIGDISRTNVSIKLSALYEKIKVSSHEESKEKIAEQFRKILDTSMAHHAYVHIDVEQYELLSLTHDTFMQVLMERPYRKYPHIGIVCQAYLKESESHLRTLIQFAKDRGTPFAIRLVKGAYWDYEQAHAEQMDWPCPVFDNKAETDHQYEKLTEQLIIAFPHIRPIIGSHNARSLAVAITSMEKHGLNKEDVEFQMLNGMAEEFRDYIASQGFRIRQYCPIGEFIPGMSYLVRRLLENTANQSFLRMHGHESKNSEELITKPVLPEHLPQKEKGFTNHALLNFSQKDNRKRAEQALKEYLPTQAIEVNKTAKSHLTHICPWDKNLIVTKAGLSKIEDTDKAIENALHAWKEWRETPVNERAKILEKAASLIIKRWDEIFALQVYEAGKDWLHADADIAEGIDFFRCYAQQMKTIHQNFQPTSLWGESNHTIYEPRGLTAVIAPWNFPFAISAGMTSAALVSGNPVIYKPAEQTSAIGEFLTEIYREAGIPQHIFTCLHGKGETVGAHLVNHPDIATIAFTGSKEVGLEIMKKAGSHQKGQTHLKKCIIEMGGKNAIIIDSDADLDEAVPAVVKSAFGFAGQKCSACSRVIIIGSAYKPFTERLKEMVNGLTVGEATDPQFDVNAVIDKNAFDKINQYIKIGKKDGKLLAQGNLANKNGYFIPPTVFTDLNKTSKLTTDEVFGPVLSVYKTTNIEEAINMALDTPYALTGGIFSRNPHTLEYAKTHFKVGNLYINRGITGALVGRQPFGGSKLSGTNAKAGGADYLFHFLEARVITENTMRRGYAPKED